MSDPPSAGGLQAPSIPLASRPANQENERVTSTRPAASNSRTIPDEDGKITHNDFVKHLDIAAATHSPPSDFKDMLFSQVHVRCFSWTECDLSSTLSEATMVPPEIRDLMKVFGDYGYTVSHDSIPCNAERADNYPEVWLNNKISSTAVDLTRDDLLIIYYAGHGGDVRGGDGAMWYSSSEPIQTVTKQTKHKVYSLNFTNVQQYVDKMECKVLYILDTCYAATAAVSHNREVLAACAVETTATGVSHQSFTRNLIDELETAGSKFDWLNVASLHARLVERVLDGRLLVTPVRVERKTIRTATPSIPFLPLTDRYGRPKKYKLTGGPDSWRVQKRKVTLRTRVLLSAKIREGNPDTMKTLQRMIKDNPTVSANVLVDLLSNTVTSSSVLIFSIDVATWSCLPSHPAMFFLEFYVPVLSKQSARLPAILPAPIAEATSRTVAKVNKTARKVSDSLRDVTNNMSGGIRNISGSIRNFSVGSASRSENIRPGAPGPTDPADLAEQPGSSHK